MQRYYYYRSTHPEIAAQEAAFHEREQVYEQKVAEFEAEFGLKAMVDVYAGYKVLSAFGTGEPISINGAKQMIADGKIDPRLTLLQGCRNFTPNRKTKEGKALARQMDQVRLEWMTLTGIPMNVYSSHEMKRYSPNFSKIGDVYWVAYACEYQYVEEWPKFDGTIWERAYASEYWLAVEAEEAMHGTPKQL